MSARLFFESRTYVRTYIHTTTTTTITATTITKNKSSHTHTHGDPTRPDLLKNPLLCAFCRFFPILFVFMEIYVRQSCACGPKKDIICIYLYIFVVLCELTDPRLISNLFLPTYYPLSPRGPAFSLIHPSHRLSSLRSKT